MNPYRFKETYLILYPPFTCWNGSAVMSLSFCSGMQFGKSKTKPKHFRLTIKCCGLTVFCQNRTTTNKLVKPMIWKSVGLETEAYETLVLVVCQIRSHGWSRSRFLWKINNILGLDMILKSGLVCLGLTSRIWFRIISYN